MSLLLMAFLLVTGAVMIHRDTGPWRSGGLTPPLVAPLAPR
jgi:hypothetical protein